MKTNSPFANQIILVTGGSSGIGLATALRFSTLGATRVYSLDLHEPPTASKGITHIECDIRNGEKVRASLAKIRETEGRIDVLFANAGVFALGDIEETSDEALNRVLDTNIKGTWYSIQAALKVMRAQQRGAIIINGSDQSLVGRPKSAVYGLTKGALGQLTKNLALDYAPYGIRVNCVCPAAVDTPLCRKAITEWAERYGGDVHQLTKEEHAMQPIGRMAEPEDVAALVCFLASEEARNITGALISTDGGYVAR